MTFELDPELRQYATDRQWEKLTALQEHGTERLAANALGIGRSSVHSTKKAVLANAARHGYAPEYDLTH